MLVVRETEAAEVRLGRVASGVCDTIDELVRAMQAHESAFTAESFRDATKLKQGTHNSIWAPALVGASGPPIVLRVATVDDPPEEFAQEMRNAVCAAKHGFGLAPLYFANMEVDGAVRGVSCWPRGTCAHEHLAKLPKSDHPAFGLRVLATLRAAAEWILPLDAASMANYVVLDEQLAMIDFDTYYTKVPRTDAQRAAAKGFVVVAATLLACATGSGMFGVTQLARLADVDVDALVDDHDGDGPPGHEGICAALCAAVTARCAAICAAFREARVVLARLVHAYVCHGVAKNRKPTSDAFAAIARAAKAESIAPFQRLVRNGKIDAYIGAFVRLAVASAFDTSAAFDAELARLVDEYASLLATKRKRE
jgi:hypothetical protein